MACFFRGDCDGVLQIAASRSDTGEYNLMGELASHFKRNSIEYKTNNIVEYKTKQDILSRIPMGKKGEFEDIAITIQFLIEEASYITGQIIAVDGGRSLNS